MLIFVHIIFIKYNLYIYINVYIKNDGKTNISNL